MYLHFMQPGATAWAPGEARKAGWKRNRLFERKLNWPNHPEMYSIAGCEHVIASAMAATGETREQCIYGFRKTQHEAQMNVENIFDKMRPAGVPSRRECMFVFDESIGADAYATKWKINLHGPVIRLVPLDDAITKRVRRTMLDCTGMSTEVIEAHAHSYWRDDPGPELDSEVLLIGPYKVIGV